MVYLIFNTEALLSSDYNSANASVQSTQKLLIFITKFSTLSIKVSNTYHIYFEMCHLSVNLAANTGKYALSRRSEQ